MKKLGTNMLSKLHYLHSQLDKFSGCQDDLSEKKILLGHQNNGGKYHSGGITI